MTIVNHDTGEVIDLDVEAATRRADQISTRLTGIKESFEQVLPKIRQSIELRDDVALGYNSPGHYISERFGAALTGLPVDLRRAAVAELTEVGMSTRAIAPVLGVSNKTVSKDRGVTEVTPHANPNAQAEAQARIDAREDKARQRAYQGLDDLVAADCSRPAPAVPEDATTQPQVTGLDGKKYTRPTRRLAAVPEPVEYDDQDHAEELARNLSRNLSLLYAVTNPERRAEYIATWRDGIKEVQPLGSDFITPEHMRTLAAALESFADEWEFADV